MEKISIVGGRPLFGEARVSGAKNAALPALFAALLTDAPVRIPNLPRLRDTASALAALAEMGAEVDEDADGGATARCANLRARRMPYQLVKTMRASVLALGPLTARWGEARVALPGGCAIGARPVNEHLHGLEKLGADIRIDNGDIVAQVNRPGGRLKGARIVMEIPSFTGTENLMMAACLAEGETILENAAREPEVADLAKLLTKMGARIAGAGESVIRIHGVAALNGAAHRVMPDRIEAGTYAAATAACGGATTLRDAPVQAMDSVLEKLRETGAEIEVMEDADGDDEDDGMDGVGGGVGSLRIVMKDCPRAADATTGPHPGFPTDMQAQLVALNCAAAGAAAVTETVFENRFMHAPELARMGADIRVHGNTAHVRGAGGLGKLTGAPVMATDLRASASLAVAALTARGETRIDRVYHLDRGYERMDEKLRQLGAQAERTR